MTSTKQGPRVMTAVLYVLLALVAAGVGAFAWAATTGRPLPTQVLFPDHAAPVADFAALETSPTPNRFLVCPARLCAKTTPDLEPPVFDQEPGAIYALVRTLVRQQPQVSILEDDEQAMRLALIQRTPILGFPDTITIAVLPAEGGRATLAMASQSRYGTWDLGKNAARLQTWLAELERLARPVSLTLPPYGS